MKRTWRSAYFLVVVVILACSATLIFLPSARKKRQEKAIAELSKSYMKDDLKEVAELLKGHFLSTGNNNKPIRSDEAAFIVIWAPFPGSLNAFNEIGLFTQITPVDNYRKFAKKMLFIAPHKDCAGWTLFGKLELANSYLGNRPERFFNIQGQMAANPGAEIPKLQKQYDELPKGIRDHVERDLHENLTILYRYQKTTPLFQTGLGPYFRIHEPLFDRCVGIAGNALPFRDPAR